MYGQQASYNFNPYAAGNKMYGFGRSNPTSGPVDKLGYRERDAETRLRRNALLRRMKAMSQGNYMSAPYLGSR